LGGHLLEKKQQRRLQKVNHDRNLVAATLIGRPRQLIDSDRNILVVGLVERP
jgi:hypothetical protein